MTTDRRAKIAAFCRELSASVPLDAALQQNDIVVFQRAKKLLKAGSIGPELEAALDKLDAALRLSRGEGLIRQQGRPTLLCHPTPGARPEPGGGPARVTGALGEDVSGQARTSHLRCYGRVARAWPVPAMTSFLTEAGRKLADRWAGSLAVPGLLYLAAVTTAIVLGQRDALNYLHLSKQIAAWAASPALKSAGGAVLIAAFVLPGSVAVGLVASAGGEFIERLWAQDGSRLPGKWLADRRRTATKSSRPSRTRTPPRTQLLWAGPS